MLAIAHRQLPCRQAPGRPNSYAHAQPHSRDFQCGGLARHRRCRLTPSRAIGSSGDKKEPMTRDAEPEEFWQTKAEREGKSAWQDPLAIIGLMAIFFPFVVLGVAIGTGYVDINAGRP